jgi:hypothetical protein
MYQGKFKDCYSNKKRRIIGEKRKELKTKLVYENQSAAYVQRFEAKQVMQYGDKEPSHLMSLNAMRILKYKALKKNQSHSDTIMALSILKGTPPYNNIIHDRSYDKFFVHYWVSTEINSYRIYAKNTDIPKITIDATGGVVKNLF